MSFDVIAWIPCSVPARMRMVLSGNGGNVSVECQPDTPATLPCQETTQVG